MMITSEAATPVTRLAPAAEALDHLVRHRSDDALWFAEVETSLLTFRSTLVTHTRSIVEDDLYRDATWKAPRIVIQVRRLGAECFKLDELSALSLTALHSPNRSAGSVAETLNQVLRLAARHESRALAIDHEAFCVDIGGQG
ncbi:MAG: hypothetical protein H8E59_02920 [Actinobacteria bacterium]|nr:hypothetical protein [Actinomycetota bacterium]